jgi:tetratricopeptide (TPR) repeat protein
MKQRFIPILFLVFAMGACFFFQKSLGEKREIFLKENYMGYTLPSKIIGPASLEFSGIVSDFLFLKITTFFGGKFIQNEQLEEKHAIFLYDSMDILTDLDPWFWDAYLVADMILAWDFGKIDLANKLLFKAREYRTNDFQVPYHIGFNYFYFLKDNAKGAKYLMEAAQLPNAPGYLSSLATRLSMYQNQYGPAILFLNDILKSNHNPELQKQLEIRLETLLIMDGLEKKVHEFKKMFGIFPDQLSDLVDRQLVEFIPNDPYGGKFILLGNKRVYATSKMIYK